MNIVERKRRLTSEAQAMANAKAATSMYDEASEEAMATQTEDINSEEGDIFTRKANFEKLAKRFQKHQQEKGLLLRGNDLRSNVWLKKMNKLARDDLGLDLAGYRDYVHNLKEFASVNDDLSIFALDSHFNEPDRKGPTGLLQFRVAKAAAEFKNDESTGVERVQKHSASV